MSHSYICPNAPVVKPNFFDLLPAGRGEWLPDNDYPGDARGESSA
jgi:hypothetical protein